MHLLSPRNVVKSLPRNEVNRWKEEHVLDFCGHIDFSRFTHLERSSINLGSDITFLSAGKGESQGNYSTQKKVAIAKKNPTKFHFISGTEKKIGGSKGVLYPEAELDCDMNFPKLSRCVMCILSG